MFLTNSGNDDGKPDAKGNRDKLLNWKTANDIPWGMLLLFAGGICIAKAFTASGLSVLMGTWLTGLYNFAGNPADIGHMFIRYVFD